jgi:hypothetical protein
MVTYPDFSSWNAAVGVVTTVAIPDSVLFTFLGSGDASVTYSGVIFSTSSALGNGSFFNIGSVFASGPAVLSSQNQTVGVANILITLPEAVTAVALDYGTFGGSNVTFTLSNGDNVTQPSSGSGYAVSQFYGVTDSTPFTSVLVTSSDSVLNLNNVSFTDAAETVAPEPATLTMLGMSIASMAGYGWRRRKMAI